MSRDLIWVARVLSSSDESDGGTPPPRPPRPPSSAISEVGTVVDVVSRNEADGVALSPLTTDSTADEQEENGMTETEDNSKKEQRKRAMVESLLSSSSSASTVAPQSPSRPPMDLPPPLISQHALSETQKRLIARKGPPTSAARSAMREQQCTPGENPEVGVSSAQNVVAAMDEASKRMAETSEGHVHVHETREGHSRPAVADEACRLSSQSTLVDRAASARGHGVGQDFHNRIDDAGLHPASGLSTVSQGADGPGRDISIADVLIGEGGAPCAQKVDDTGATVEVNILASDFALRSPSQVEKAFFDDHSSHRAQNPSTALLSGVTEVTSAAPEPSATTRRSCVAHEPQILGFTFNSKQRPR